MQASKQIHTAIILIPHLNQHFYLIQYSRRHLTTLTTTVAKSTSTVAYRNYNIETKILNWINTETKVLDH